MDNFKENELFKGKFRTHISHFICCSKLIEVFMTSNKETILIYYDEKYEKLFFSIPFKNIISAGKHQIKPNDIYTFSIFYVDKKKSNGIGEIKLRVSYRRDVEVWIEKFKSTIKKYKFELKDDEVEICEYLTFFQREPKLFYEQLTKLENIICTYKVIKFLTILKEINPNKENRSNNEKSVNLDEIDVNFEVNFL
jgi:hypothetical protein